MLFSNQLLNSSEIFLSQYLLPDTKSFDMRFIMSQVLYDTKIIHIFAAKCDFKQQSPSFYLRSHSGTIRLVAGTLLNLNNVPATSLCNRGKSRDKNWYRDQNVATTVPSSTNIMQLCQSRLEICCSPTYLWYKWLHLPATLQVGDTNRNR